MTEFVMDADWLCFAETPERPKFRVPARAVDAHCHVFGPADRFPYAAERKYTPCDAPKEKLWALRDFLGFERNVIVQATCHGHDNRALCDALESAQGRARGVASVPPDVSDEDVEALHRAGVRGARFNFVKRLVDARPEREYSGLARRLAGFGWHVVVYFEAADLPERHEFFATLPAPLVVDHMGRPDVSKDPDGAEFGRFLALMREHGDIWCKVSCPERLSRTGPPDYADVIPFARRVIEEFPDRVLWGTDWPHPNMKSHMPDDGLLVDFIPNIATTEELRRKLLVDNPMRLYWPEETH
jgi:2-pyrone-4,6-dicarboxylate lactonase